MLEFTYNRISITKFSYNIILILKFHISRRSSDRDLVQKVPLGTLQNRTDFLCFLFVHYLDRQHISIFLHRLVTMNERNTTQ